MVPNAISTKRRTACSQSLSVAQARADSPRLSRSTSQAHSAETPTASTAHSTKQTAAQARTMARGRSSMGEVCRACISRAPPTWPPIALPHDRPADPPRRPRPCARRSGQARAVRRGRGPGARCRRCPPYGDRGLRGQARGAEEAREADPAGPGRREAGAARPDQDPGRRGQGGRGRPGCCRGGVAGGGAEHPGPGRRRGARGRRGRLQADREGRHPGRVRLRAARPHRARQDPRRHRHRARRQGVRLAVLLPHRRRR